MSLINPLLRALRPKTLVIQLYLPVLLLLMPAAGLFAWFAVSNLAQEQREAVKDKLVHIGETFQGSPLEFDGRTNRAIEHFLLLAAEPPITQIAIADEQGNNVLAAVKPLSAKAYLDEDARKFHLPANYSAKTLISTGEINYWLPVKSANGNNYWLATSASFQNINRWEHQWLLLSFTGLFILFGVLTPLSVYKAAKIQKALRITAQFANSISSNPNSEMASHTDNVDLDNLVNALNRISKNWHHRLQLSEQNSSYLRMHKVAIDLHSAVCITNGNGRIEYVNKHFCIASGYNEKELVGKNISLLNSGYHDDHYFKNLWRTLTLGRVWQGDLCNRNRRGEPYWVNCTIAPIKDKSGHHSQYIAIQTPAAQAHHEDYVASAK